MGCPALTERDYFKLHKCTEKTAYSRFSCTATDDHIGNRKTYDTTESGSNVQSVYSANNLNQYTNITNPSQSPTYDDDGNMLTMTLASGSWTNTFNAENRIIAQEKSDARLEYVYDYMGRRVEKKVYSGSVGNWVLDEDWRFVYDQYKKIESLDALHSNGIAKKNVWREEEERLLSETIGANTYYSMSDANKNVSEYLDSSGTIQTHYEYSPFGKIVAKTGTMQNDFDYRFSSEFYDQETGLSYYNFRYYSAELGRWLSRDLIMEEGGYNLYGMAENNAIGYFDYLGLEKLCKQTGVAGFTLVTSKPTTYFGEIITDANYQITTFTCKCEYLCCEYSSGGTCEYTKEWKDQFKLKMAASYGDFLLRKLAAINEEIDQQRALLEAAKIAAENPDIADPGFGDVADALAAAAKAQAALKHLMKQKNLTERAMAILEEKFQKKRRLWLKRALNICKQTCKRGNS